VLTIAAKLGLLPGLFAVIAAVLAERTVWLHHAVTRGVGALCRFSHRSPLFCSELYASKRVGLKLSRGIERAGIVASPDPNRSDATARDSMLATTKSIDLAFVARANPAILVSCRSVRT
jgi:predicted cobalt transporter CbtA